MEGGAEHARGTVPADHDAVLCGRLSNQRNQQYPGNHREHGQDPSGQGKGKTGRGLPPGTKEEQI